MERAVLYARVSSRVQRTRGRSLETQLDRCRDYAVAHGYQVTATYCDVHTGADLLGRPELGRMRTAIRAGTIDVVIVLTVDRLSRDLVHLHFLLVEAEAVGARFEFVLEHLDQTPEGQLLRAIQGFAAEIERLTIRERARQSVRARVRRGRWLGVTPPFGYRWHRDQRGTLEIEETRAAVVRWLFSAVVDGLSPREIADRLNADAIPTARACPTGWSAKTIRCILRNPIYRGGLGVAEPSPNLLSQTHRGVSERYLEFPRSIPPSIVTSAQWQAANHRLQALTRQESVFPDPIFPAAYLLAGGLVRCGQCGRALLGRGVRAETLVYRCAGTSRQLTGRCPGLRRAASTLDERVWRRVLRTATKGGARPPTPTTTRRSVIVAATGADAGMVPPDGAQSPTPTTDAVIAAWRDLAQRAAADPIGLQGTTFAERRMWLLRLAIQVYVWPRGSGRGVEVITRIDAAADGTTQ